MMGNGRKWLTGAVVYGSVRTADLRETGGGDSELISIGSSESAYAILPGTFQDEKIIFQSLQYYWILLCGCQVYPALPGCLFTFHNDTCDG